METQDAALPAPPLESYLAAIESLVQRLIEGGEFELKFDIRKNSSPPSELEAPDYVVDFSGADGDLLLEKNAALMNALEYVVLKAVRLEEQYFGKITFDCQDWRRSRAEELKLTAQMAAERVMETGDPFTLNPMTPRERRIVHLALRDRPQVRTASEGAGAERKVVILPVSTRARGA
jgi:spoIIIJ-associated protein